MIWHVDARQTVELTGLIFAHPIFHVDNSTIIAQYWK